MLRKKFVKYNHRPIELAVFFDQPLHSGGGFQQSINILFALRKIPNKVAKVKVITNSKLNAEILSDYGIDAQVLKITFFDKFIINIRNSFLNKRISKTIKYLFGYNKFEDFFIKRKVDLIYFISPCRYSEYLDEINFILTVWDLCHIDHPEFPEVREHKEFEIRENYYKKSLKKSIAVIVESEIGKQKVIEQYGVKPERCAIIDLFPSKAILSENALVKIEKMIDVRKKFNVKYPYIFYPAQFWPHKNHSYLLEGIKVLEKYYNKKISVIFSGSDRGNMNFIKEKVAKLDLTSRVHFIGFVANSEIASIYQQAIALVMPTYFGPTNIPPLEAFYLGTPVLYSNLPEFKTQANKAALFMDLEDPKSMAKHLNLLLRDKNKRKELISLGKLEVKKYRISNNVESLILIIKKFSRKKAAWSF
ncbi:glycosyltransferase family 4 protein [Candidatus Methylopumilus universalis]|nr:glycosyltransferase family 4 protein [Candidatus Methylopumilus universalis]